MNRLIELAQKLRALAAADRKAGRAALERTHDDAAEAVTTLDAIFIRAQEVREAISKTTKAKPHAKKKK